MYKTDALYWCDENGIYHEVVRIGKTQAQRLDEQGRPFGLAIHGQALWMGATLNLREEMHIREQEKDRTRTQSLDGTTRRIIFVCRSCKHRWAYDYTVHTHFVSPGVIKLDLYRASEKETLTPSHDGRWCPQCQSRRITANKVKGTYNPQKKCDGRCRNAKGPHCDCSCGGEHHGENHLSR